MAIQMPRQPAYYYEASNASFRLVYYMPLEMVQALGLPDESWNKISRDYPDGVDLGCTEPDFQEFEELYGYRPPYDPEALQRAFFTIFSSTRNWKKFRGSGLVRADVLEQALEKVEASLADEKLVQKKIKPYAQTTSLTDQRNSFRQRDKSQKRLTSHLQQLEVDVVDPRRTMSQQEFPAIQMKDGMSAETVFTKLHRKQKGV